MSARLEGPSASLFWPLILLAALTVLLFVGGWAQDYSGSDHGIKPLLGKNVLPAPQFQDALKFQAERGQRAHEAAKSLYDIAKVSLGALIGCVTQLVSGQLQIAAVRKTSGETP